MYDQKSKSWLKRANYDTALLTGTDLAEIQCKDYFFYCNNGELMWFIEALQA